MEHPVALFERTKELPEKYRSDMEVFMNANSRYLKPKLRYHTYFIRDNRTECLVSIQRGINLYIQKIRNITLSERDQKDLEKFLGVGTKYSDWRLYNSSIIGELRLEFDNTHLKNYKANASLYEVLEARDEAFRTHIKTIIADTSKESLENFYKNIDKISSAAKLEALEKLCISFDLTKWEISDTESNRLVELMDYIIKKRKSLETTK